MLLKKRFLFFAITSLFTLAILIPPARAQVESSIGLGYLSMAIVMSVASIAAAYAVAKTGAAAIASLTEKPELFARVLIFAGLAEGIAIYGIIISLLIWITLPV